MSEYLLKGLAHIGIYTEDSEKAAAFYVENLDFRYWWRADNGPRHIVFIEQGGLILEFIGGREDNIGSGQVDHVCLEVQGIEALVEKLKEKGVVFEKEEPVGVMPSMFPKPCKNAFFKGPAGERVELFDFT